MGGGPSRRTLEEENQIAQMSQLSLSSPAEAPKAIIQTGPLFTPGIGEGLIKIVNQLDPVSFLRFTRTCKPIQNFCYNTKGIEVQFGCRDVYKDKFGCHISVYLPSTGDASVLLETRRYNPGFASEGKYFSNEDLENLLKQPFLINVREVYFCPSPRDKVRARDLAQLRTLLRRFPRVRLGNIDPFIVADWNAFAQLIQEFGAKKIHIDSWITPIPVEVLPIFVNKVDDFEYHGRVPDDLILSATSKRLRLPHAAISQDTFKELLKRFRGGFLHRWFLGREINPGEEDLFLVDVCWEVMEVVSVKEIEETNMKPDVLYVVPQDSERQFYMLKYDGSVGKIVVDRLFVDFGSRLP